MVSLITTFARVCSGVREEVVYTSVCQSSEHQQRNAGHNARNLYTYLTSRSQRPNLPHYNLLSFEVTDPALLVGRDARAADGVKEVANMIFVLNLRCTCDDTVCVSRRPGSPDL